MLETRLSLGFESVCSPLEFVMWRGAVAPPSLSPGITSTYGRDAAGAALLVHTTMLRVQLEHFGNGWPAVNSIVSQPCGLAESSKASQRSR